MERLTYSGTKEARPDVTIQQMLTKLAEYEDLEEQGKVLKPSCAKGRKEIKSKIVPVEIVIDSGQNMMLVQGLAIITNDANGKTLSLAYGSRHMLIAFEQVEKYLKD